MGNLLTFDKHEQAINSQGKINNNVIVEPDNVKLEFMESLLIALLVLKSIEVVCVVYITREYEI